MDTTNWQSFRLKDIFEIYTSSDKNYLESEDGNVPYISSTRFNNGVSSYVQAETTQNKNTITVARNGSVGSAFYHSYNYCASPDDVRIFRPKFEMNKYIALFLCTLIEKEKYRFAYGRKFGTKRMQIITIKLPVKQNNNIDWKWIENYVKNTLVPKLPQKARSVWNNNYIKGSFSDEKITINTENWKWFALKNIFEMEKGKRLVKPEREEGFIPLITAGYKNEGVAEYISNEEMKHYSNAITIDMFSYCFYREYVFCCDDNILVLSNKMLNKYSGLFIVTVLDNERYKYQYGRQYRQKNFKKHKIKLPVANDGAPDWQFMEDYIKSLPYSKSI